MRRAYALSTVLLSALLVAIGIAVVVSALVRGGGPLALGVVVGIGIAAFGAGRLWLARGGGP